MNRRNVLQLCALGFGMLALAFPAFAGKQAGAVIIRDEPQYWNYVFPELSTMKADVAMPSSTPAAWRP